MEQLELTFRAENQCLEATNFTPPLFVASNTVDWLVAKFDLGTNWDCWDLGAVKAIWTFTKGRKYIAILNADGVCEIPHEVLGAMTGEVKVNLVASTLEDDEVIERMTTYPLYCINVNKVAQIDGDNSVAITPSEYEQFVEDVQEYAQTAVSARDDALQAKDDAGDYALYAKDYSESAESYRDEAKGYAEDAEEASQSILGLEATASVDANVGTPSVNVSVSEVSGNKVMDFDFHNLKGVQGEQGVQGEDGADGFSPVVAVSEITGGHEVTITDAQGDHSFDVMDGNVENFYSFLPTDSASGSIASFPDGANNVPMLSLVAEIDPIQDLHGQDAPYPAGGGKNIIPPNYSSATVNGVTFTVNADGTITASGLASADADFMIISAANIDPLLTSGQSYTFSGCPSGGGADKYMTRFNVMGKTDYGSGDTFTYNGGTPGNFTIRIKSGYNAQNLVFKPMVCLSSAPNPTTFAPYSNICPISGRTEVKTVREGKNLWNGADAPTLMPVYGVDGNIYGERQGYILRLPVGTYTFSAERVSSEGAYIYATVLNANGTFVELAYLTADTTGYIRTLSLSKGQYFVVYDAQAFSGATAKFDKFKIQLEVGSTATTYQPYQGVTITTELGQTVYGGTLDVVSGVLTVDRAMVDLGSLGWYYQSDQLRFVTSDLANLIQKPSSGGVVANIITSMFIATDYNHTINNANRIVNAIAVYTNGNVYISTDSYTDAATFKTAMNGVQLCYELATPITIQLTPQEVRTLLGTNNIWSDSGDTQATYKADIQRYIDKQISAVLNA